MPSLSDMISYPQGDNRTPHNVPAVKTSPAGTLSFHGLEDHDFTRESINNGVKDALSSLPPVENERFKITLSNVKFKGPSSFNKEEQKEALMKQTSLHTKLYGTWQMHDKNTGAVVDKQEALLAHIPYFTERGTFIRNGNEYSLAHQSRLRSGVYSLRKQNGELQSQFNAESGRGFKLVMDPTNGKFNIQLGGAKLSMMPILHELGLQPDQIQQSIGKELYARNNVFDDSAKRAGQQFDVEKYGNLKNAFAQIKMDPEVNKVTLGTAYDHVHPHAILDAAKKLISISKNEVEEDNRDALHFQRILSPADLFKERITNDAVRGMRTKMLWQSTNRGSLAAKPGYFTPHLDSVLLKSGLAQTLEETNPLEIVDQHYRVLRTGEHGIDPDRVTMESRSVQPSHFGFIDAIRSPECYTPDTKVYTRAGWKYWPEVTANDELACLVNGALQFNKPIRVMLHSYEGVMYGGKSEYIDYLVTPNHNLYVKPYHKTKLAFRLVRADSVGSKKTPRVFLCGGFGAYVGDNTLTQFVVPTIVRKSNNTKIVATPIPMEDWAEFMGWYLSEGGIDVTKKNTDDQGYRIRISQKKPEYLSEIKTCLNKLPFQFSKHADGGFTCWSKQLYSYLFQFGDCYKKHIPSYLFDAPINARKKLLQALLNGDGRTIKLNSKKHTQNFRVASEQLARDVQRLAISLGYSTNFTFHKDTRQLSYVGCWNVSIHTCNERVINSWASIQRAGKQQYYTIDYKGFVYCAEVPGHLLYVRRGVGLAHWSGNSGGVGTDSRFTSAVVRGSDGQMYTHLKNKAGQVVPVNPSVAANSIIAFPGELQKDGRRIKAMVRGKMEYVDRRFVNYEMANHTHMSTLGINLIPMVSAVSGNRALMGAKFYNQALSLVTREAPYVHALTDDGKTSFQEAYGTKVGAMRSEHTGTVTKVTDKAIHVTDKDGQKHVVELYNNFPFNRKSFIHNTPQVQVGQKVGKGDLLASSNFTDNKGTMALGKNLLTGYMAYKGLNWEDGIVISESAAKKLTSEHMYTRKIDHDAVTQRGKGEFLSLYPSMFKDEHLKGMGEDGVVKPGTVLKQGHPIILAVRQKPITDLHKGKKPGWMDASEIWEHGTDGLVTDVTKDKHGIRVTIKSHEQMQQADKLAANFGDKGTVSKIIPDAQMPHTKDGRVLDVLLNPMGVVSRSNPAQLYECLLGKIAEKTGRTYKLNSFRQGKDKGFSQFVKNELDKAGVKDTEELVDPVTGRVHKDILVGQRYMFKLHHMAEHKLQGRGVGGYTAEGLPAKADTDSSKRLGLADLSALISHNATAVLQDAKVVRGQSNHDYWKAFQLGQTPKSPEIPLVYKKFHAHLTGAGVNVKKTGSGMQLMALTDKDIDQLSHGEIKEARGVDAATMKEIPGGLFDKSITGGHSGSSWSHVNLHEPILNPVMEEPARRILGVTQQGLEDIISGKTPLHDRIGGEALIEALKRISPDQLKKKAEDMIRSGSRAKHDGGIKLLGYASMFAKTGLKPVDMVLHKVPVLPPIFRPITTTPNFVMKADANSLYVEMMKANEALRDVKKTLGNDQAGDERLNAYNAFKAVTGLGDTTSTKLKQQGVAGLLGHVFGTSSPKHGLTQRRILGGALDTVGRAVISPNPQLDIDHVGIPEEAAWKMYKPFMVRRLVKRGMQPTDAIRNIVGRTDVAKQAMLEEMNERPVLYNRAPTLHKYSIMAAMPILSKSHSMELSPMLCRGFGADHDGDQMNFHIPVSDKAVVEAKKKMLPSRNLFAIKDFDVHYLPEQEFQHGLFLASKKADKNATTHEYKTREEALLAFKRGELELDSPVKIKET